jgi:hypothetical protein
MVTYRQTASRRLFAEAMMERYKYLNTLRWTRIAYSGYKNTNSSGYDTMGSFTSIWHSASDNGWANAVAAAEADILYGETTENESGFQVFTFGDLVNPLNTNGFEASWICGRATLGQYLTVTNYMTAERERTVYTVGKFSTPFNTPLMPNHYATNIIHSRYGDTNLPTGGGDIPFLFSIVSSNNSGTTVEPGITVGTDDPAVLWADWVDQPDAASPTLCKGFELRASFLLDWTVTNGFTYYSTNWN